VWGYGHCDAALFGFPWWLKSKRLSLDSNTASAALRYVKGSRKRPAVDYPGARPHDDSGFNLFSSVQPHRDVFILRPSDEMPRRILNVCVISNSPLSTLLGFDRRATNAHSYWRQAHG